MQRQLLGILLLGLGLGACGADPPADGTEGGVCFGNGTCNRGLECRSHLCVVGASGSGGKSGSGGTKGDAGEGGEPQSGGKSGKGGTGGTGGTGDTGGDAGDGMGGGPTCGDGEVDSGERCDRGNENGETACPYGDDECDVCTDDCRVASGKVTFCGDGKVQSAHEDCDRGGASTETCDYGDEACTGCSATCKSLAEYCGDGKVDGRKPTSIKLEYLASVLYDDMGAICEENPSGLTFSLNGVVFGAPSGDCPVCGTPTMRAITLTPDERPELFAALAPEGNVLEFIPVPPVPQQEFTTFDWARLTFSFDGVPDVSVLALNPVGNDPPRDSVECDQLSIPLVRLRSAPIGGLPTEQCDGKNCNACSTVATVPDFAGEVGPVFPGWSQCAGYLDHANEDDLPETGWGEGCRDYTEIRVVCGASAKSYRYLDAWWNFFSVKVTGPLDGYFNGAWDEQNQPFDLESQTFLSPEAAEADGAPIDSFDSYWGANDGCVESDRGLYVDSRESSSCPWEVSNCFGQQLPGDRHLWVYAR